MPTSEDYLGYIKYDGRLVPNGWLDARKASDALLGFDEAVRYFVGKQSQTLARSNYEMPVKVEGGSWLSIVPESIGDWVAAALGTGALAYAATAGQKMAENDFSGVGIRMMFRKALLAIQWMIRIGKHLGSVAVKTFDNARWGKDNTEIGIPNDAGEYLYVPVEFFKLYASAPVHLLTKVARIVAEERSLSVVVSSEEGVVTEELTYVHKRIFCEDEEDVLFPELEHGMSVTLEGLVTRGNESANSIGFKYNDHILTCYPESGSVVTRKQALFLPCRITGVITRANRIGEPVEPRPKILFTNLEPLDVSPPEPVLGLFDDEK